MFANQHFIGIHALAAGTKVLRPYQKSRVTDAFTGERIADGVEEFTMDLPFGVTRSSGQKARPDDDGDATT